MQRIHLYTPATRTCRSETFLATVKQLTRKHIKVGEGELDEESKAVHILVIPADMPDNDRKQMKTAVENFYRQRCCCEHDCCGHWTGGVRSAKFINKREMVVHTSYSRNY